MHLRMDNLDWNQPKAFLEAAETGALPAAARTLGLTQPTLSRQEAAIEQRMSVTRFERVGTPWRSRPAGWICWNMRAPWAPPPIAGQGL